MTGVCAHRQGHGQGCEREERETLPQHARLQSSIRRTATPGQRLPPVQIPLPNGTYVRSEFGEVDRLLSAYFKRNVTLGRAAPDDFTIDQYHPEVEGADPGGNRDTVVASKLGVALFAKLGMKNPRFLSVLSSMCFPSRS